MDKKEKALYHVLLFGLGLPSVMSFFSVMSIVYFFYGYISFDRAIAVSLAITFALQVAMQCFVLYAVWHKGVTITVNKGGI